MAGASLKPVQDACVFHRMPPAASNPPAPGEGTLEDSAFFVSGCASLQPGAVAETCADTPLALRDAVEGKSPYFVSPTRMPIGLQVAPIWCVRPVSMVTLEQRRFRPPASFFRG